MDLKEAYRALDPAHPLEPDSPFYVARHDNPVSRIIAELQLTDLSRQYLLTGHRGTGKTTELNRIEQALSHDYVIRRVSVDSPSPSLLTTIVKQVDPPSRPLMQFISTTDAGLSTTDLEHMLSKWLSDMSDNRPPLLLIDGIDKLGMRDLDDRYFQDFLTMRRSQVSIVCTIPLILPLTEHFGDISQSIDAWHFLPSIDLWDRGWMLMEPAWEMCRDVIRRRADIFTEAALHTLVLNSAGIHRELLRLAQRACVFAAVDGMKTVEEEEVRRAVQDARNEYSLLLRSEDFDLLRRVERTGQISGDPKLLRLVRDQLIVAYGGGSTWFAVHPIVQPLIPNTRKKVASQ